MVWLCRLRISTRFDNNWQNLAGNEGEFKKSESEGRLYGFSDHPKTTLQQFMVYGLWFKGGTFFARIVALSAFERILP